ncbi:glycoside hydrolase family 32 protein [Hymenobacter armeniacus]|uniref:Glycoside hydrolase family 32 protein n=1 Tax=Hymenobacter armeniacus TaxID=2771358 RepID=A0ABR8JS21_9BACT|nr:glycoside hydrolase family 32 protein [Hymenobacter armeniacus]MBD2722766.1 glycoside hydrolase family 32 protein [Hymenobacter armeniacus]
MKNLLLLTGFLLTLPVLAQGQTPAPAATPQYRPSFHFTPAAKWMNDPNGMVFYQGEYHLFFQHYPAGDVWGPMHWGHATSKDLVRWQPQPIALYPDSLGYIFSGSAVVDAQNTSGFGKNGQVPLVAIFTHHDPKGEKAGTRTFQNQSLAYSLDAGKTWTKYAGNPVLKNPGIQDFRDPKVSWHAPSKRWVMTLATKDRITFFASPNLKDWTKLSEFGEKLGGHGGVWECPDLFPLTLDGKTHWVLLISINPGGPQGGSATQYFVGDFDGKTFTPSNTRTRWIDYGRDNYAGVTWGNTGARRIFLGWMNNWDYATTVPTAPWRSAMTVPRELSLRRVGNDISLVQQPVAELAAREKTVFAVSAKTVAKTYEVPYKGTAYDLTLDLKPGTARTLTLNVLQSAGETTALRYDVAQQTLILDRTKSGNVAFNPKFSSAETMKVPLANGRLKLRVLVDKASVEVFAQDGAHVLTDVVFPTKQEGRISLVAEGGAAEITSLKINTL